MTSSRRSAAADEQTRRGPPSRSTRPRAGRLSPPHRRGRAARRTGRRRPAQTRARLRASRSTTRARRFPSPIRYKTRRGTEARRALVCPATPFSGRAARASYRRTEKEASARRRKTPLRFAAPPRGTARPVSRNRLGTAAWRAPPRLRAARRRAAPPTGLEPWARAPRERPLTSFLSERRVSPSLRAPRPPAKKRKTPRSRPANPPPAKLFPRAFALLKLGRHHDSPRPWPRPRPRPRPLPPPVPRPRPARSDVSRRPRSRPACRPRLPRPRLRPPPRLDRDRRAPAPPRSPRASGFPRPRRATHPRRAPSRAGPRASRGSSGRTALSVEGRERAKDAGVSLRAWFGSWRRRFPAFQMRDSTCARSEQRMG